jgi:hypothetical protein
MTVAPTEGTMTVDIMLMTGMMIVEVIMVEGRMTGAVSTAEMMTDEACMAEIELMMIDVAIKEVEVGEESRVEGIVI